MKGVRHAQCPPVMLTDKIHTDIPTKKNPGRFGPIPVRSGRFGPGCFGPISGVSRFGPIGVGRFGPVSKVGRFGPILGMSRLGLVHLCWKKKKQKERILG